MGVEYCRPHVMQAPRNLINVSVIQSQQSIEYSTGTNIAWLLQDCFRPPAMKYYFVCDAIMKVCSKYMHPVSQLPTAMCILPLLINMQGSAVISACH